MAMEVPLSLPKRSGAGHLDPDRRWMQMDLVDGLCHILEMSDAIVDSGLMLIRIVSDLLFVLRRLSLHTGLFV